MKGSGVELIQGGSQLPSLFFARFSPMYSLKSLFLLGQPAATAGMWLPIKESCILFQICRSHACCFPLFYWPYFGHKSHWVNRFSVKISLLSSPFIKPAFLSKLLSLLSPLCISDNVLMSYPLFTEFSSSQYKSSFVFIVVIDVVLYRGSDDSIEESSLRDIVFLCR